MIPLINNIKYNEILHISFNEYEQNLYEKYIDNNKIIWIQVQQENMNYDILLENIQNIILECNKTKKFNYIYIDINPIQLKILVNLNIYLNDIDYIYIKIDKNYLLINEIDIFLKKYNFYRIKSIFNDEINYGYIFYIKINQINQTDLKYIIFKPKFNIDTLGDSIFRYLACTLLIIKYNLIYMLEDELPLVEEYKFFRGVDHEYDDIEHLNTRNINNMKKYASNNDNIKCFNTFAFFKNKIDLNKLVSNEYMNENSGQGLYVKNIINVDDNNFLNIFLGDLDFNNIRMIGYFQYDDIYVNRKKYILDYINQNKYNDFIYCNKKYLMKDIIDDCFTDIYDIIIHLDNDFSIELLNKLDFSNKKCGIVIEENKINNSTGFLKKYIDWFFENNMIVDILSHDILRNFHIMKSAKILVCSMNNISWCAAYLSNKIELCYMPNYSSHKTYDKKIYFKNPIQNTVFYDL